MMYSQNDEEKYILEYFGDYKGGVLDIGAADGLTYSNSRQLLVQGWKGVLVEPNPCLSWKLMCLYHDNPGVVCLMSPVGKAPKLLGEFWIEDPDPYVHNGIPLLSTCDEALYKQKESWPQVKFKKVYTSYVTWLDAWNLACKSGIAIDFLTLDVESYNLELLESLPDVMLRGLKLICVEHENQEERIAKHLEPHGYKVITRTNENLILGK